MKKNLARLGFIVAAWWSTAGATFHRLDAQAIVIAVVFGLALHAMCSWFYQEATACD